MMQDDNEILKEEREEMNYTDPVSKTTRFVNYIVDQVAIGVIVNGLKFGIAYLKLGENFRDHILYKVIDVDHLDMAALQNSLYVSLAVTFFYYLIFESATRGRTLGKIMTDTIAISQDGTPFTFNHALIRTLCRFIPFEMFSAVFAYLPWHDSISKTAVVKKTW
jgi:hypothetical protein